MGRLADARSRPLAQGAAATFARIFGVNLDEYEVPVEGFTSFNAFFTRRLRPGARPQAAGGHILTCPADGRLLSQGPITADAVFHIKGATYTVDQLLAGSTPDDSLRRFAGGSFAVIYLAPPDYHRVHAPVTGTVGCVRRIPGTLYPVNAIGDHIPQLLAQNERVAVFQDSTQTHEACTVATVLVGALGVGGIELPHGVGVTSALTKGDELGAFRMGSTVVVLTSSALKFTRQLGETVRVGEPLGEWKGVVS